MALKHKLDPEDDYTPSNSKSKYGSQPKRICRKASRPPSDDVCSSPTSPIDYDSDFVVPDDFSEDELAPTPKKQVKNATRTQKSTALRSHSRTSRGSLAAKKQAKLTAELANLADYNEPPVSRPRTRTACESTYKYLYPSDNEWIYPPKTSTRCRKALTLGDQLRVQGARITKPKAKVRSPKKRDFGNKLLAEVEQLQSWYGWQSEEASSSSEGESETDADYGPIPRSCIRYYAPKMPGTQNTPWSELPGEIRNKIYEYAMLNEEQKTINVVHYPDGVPRRSVRGIASTTNFAHSYWGFTQTCRQIRDEFTPWLLNRRRVRTPLGTINQYIDTFHRPDMVGKRVGWIEPICRGAPLPGDGVKALNMLQHKHDNPNFHLQLTPTTVSVVLDWLSQPTDPNEFDELKIIRDMDETFTSWSGHVLEAAGIQDIHITSLVSEDQSDLSESEDESHEILINLEVGRPQTKNTTHQYQLQNINKFIFASQIAQKEGVKLQASFNGGVARWVVRRPGTVDMQWKERKNRGANTFRRLTLAPEDLGGFVEEEL